MTAAEALGRALLAGAADYEASCQAILARDEPEDVHAARVALRRMRSVLRGFGDMLSDKHASRLNEVLAGLFRRLGPLRDADVQAAALRGAAARRKAAVAAGLRSKLRDQLAAPDGSDLTERIGAFLAKPERLFKGDRRRRLATAPVGLIGARAMQMAWTELLSFGPDLDVLTADELHDFRKRAKDLRYLTELFAPLFEGNDARRMLKRLKTLQDALGTLNDLHVMSGGATGPAEAALPEDAPQREAEARKSVRETWARLIRSPVWWTLPRR